MAKKKKDPLAAAAQQVVKKTTEKVVKQTAPKKTAQQKVQSVVKKAGTNIVKNKAPGTVKKNTANRSLKASNISGNTGRSVKKRDRDKTAKTYATMNQAKRTARSNVTATQKGEKVMGGNAVQRNVLQKNKPTRLSGMDDFMLTDRGKNEVNNAKALYEVARRNNDEAGMKLAHGMAELARLNNQTRRRNGSGDIVGPYSGGTWGDRYIEANMGNFNSGQTGLREPEKNFLRSEAYQVKSALNEAGAGYLNTLREFPLRLPEGQGSSQLVVKGSERDKYSSDIVDRRGQSRYTEEDMANKALEFQAASDAQRELGYQTTPINGRMGQFVGDITRVGTGIGLDAAANALVPGAGLVNMGARTWGSSVKQAKDEQKLRGTDKEPFADLKAYMYGTAMTGVEIATEKMFDGVKLFGKSVYGAGGATTKLGKMMDDVFNVGINRAVARLAKTPGGEAAISALMNIGKSGLEEGLEELVADFVQWQMPRIYGGDVEGAKEMLTGALYDFALGAAMGGFGGVTSTGSSMREAYLDRTNRNAEAISDRMSELGADKEQAKNALSRMTIYQLESLAEASDDVLRNTGMAMGLISPENANQSLTEASEEQRSEQTVGGGTEPTTSDGAAWKKLRKRLRDAEVRDAETLKAIRSKLTPEEMEEAAGLRKNDFLEWRDRVMSPDYKGSQNAVQEAPTTETDEEEDEGFAATPEDIKALGRKLEKLGLKGPEIARAVSDNATIDQLVNMDEEELRAWAQELTAPAQPEALAEQTELLEEQRQERQEEAQAPATPLERSASVLGAAGRTAFISSYNPSKRSDLYTAEAYRAYNAGFTGNTRPILYKTLNRASSEALYQAGVIDRLSSMRARENNKRNAISFDQETAGIDLEDKNLLKMIENAKDYEGTALQFNEADAKHLNRLLKALGKKGFFVESIDDMSDSAKRNIANGSYENGIVLFSLQTNRPISFVIGHEITHAMAEMSPKEYKRLEKYVASTEKFEEKVERIKAIYKGEGRFISQETAIEEVVADYVGEMVTDLNMLEEFARRADRNMLQKFLDALKSVARKLTGKDKADVDKAIKLVENLLDTSVKQNKRMTKTQRSVEDIMASNDTGGKHSIKSLFESAGIYVKQVDGRILATGKNGKAVTEVTTKMVRESGIGALINYAYEETGSISKEDAEKQIEGARDLLNMMLNAQDGELVWRFAGSAMFSAVKTNSDGQYGTTIDFSTVCRKTQEMMTAMSESMMDLGRGLTKDEVIELQAKILTEGGTVPCPVCYVFSRWAGIGGILDNMSKFQDKYGHEYDDPAKLDARIAQLEKATEKKANLRAMLREHDTNYMELERQKEELETDNRKKKRERNSLNKKKPEGYEAQVEELNKAIKRNDGKLQQVKADIKKMEAEGAPELAWLKRVRKQEDYWEHGNVPKKVLFNMDDAATFAESYPLAWGYRTSRGPSAGKAILPYSDMRLGDLILGPSKNSAKGNDLFETVENGQFNEKQQEAIDKAIGRTLAQNLIGGQRFQSTSDFRYDYGLDYLQVFWEAQALGSKMQTYTKIVEFAELVATVGGDVNISVMPLNNGLDENGNLLYSNVTGVDIEAAKKASQMYDSAQLILVGINDDHIRAALDDNAGHGGRDVGFVIPYHASGASINEFIRGLVENLRETFDLEYYKDYSLLQEDHRKKVPRANEALVGEWMEAMRENPLDPQFPHAKPNAAQRKALEQRLRSELRMAILKRKIGSSKEAAETLLQNENIQEFMRGSSKDISKMSFEDLLAIERRAMNGEADAIQEYESWSNGVLWDLYQKMWVDESAVDTYGVALNSGQAGSVMPHEYWNKEVNREHAFVNGFLFRSYCYNLGLVPRFTGLTSSGTRPGHGDFSDSTGYWKLLIDRPMYDNQGRYREQQKINATNITKEMLTPKYGEEKWGDFKVREPSDKVARSAAKRFVEEKRSGSKLSAREGGSGLYVTKKMDEDYLKAVQDGDMDTAQRMVDEAAKEAGYTQEAYHGTRAFGFTQIDVQKSDDEASFWVTTDIETAGTYSSVSGVRKIRKSEMEKESEKLHDIAKNKVSEFVKIYNSLADGAVRVKEERMIKLCDRIANEFANDEETANERLANAFETYADLLFDEKYADEWERFEQWFNSEEAFQIRKAISDAKWAYLDYIDILEHGESYGNYHVYINPDDLLEVDAERSRWSSVGFVPPELREIADQRAQIVSKMDAIKSRNGDQLIGHYAEAIPRWPSADIEEWTALRQELRDVDDRRKETEESLGILTSDFRLGTTREIVQYAKQVGHKGVHFQNIIDDGGFGTQRSGVAKDVYALLDPARQVKSADPVTYDDNGNIIPLSERFNPDNPDIRWSIRDDMTYDDYIARYGSIKPGERRARNVAVPKQTSDNTKVHQTVRTIMEAGRTPEDILPRLKEMIESGEFSYEVFGNREGVEYAQGVVAEKGFAEAYKDWSAEIEKKIVSPQNVAMGWVLYDTAVENKDWDMVARISMQMAKYANTIGQGLQAMRILKMFSPEMQLAVMDGPKPERVRKKLEKRKQQEEQPADTYEEEEEEDDDIDLPGAFFGEEDEEKPAQKKPRKKPQRRTPREEQSDTNEDESDTEITQKDVEETAEYQAKHSKSTLVDMWNSWRYLAMLFNARTHIRNIVGNLGFAPIVMSKNITATAAEIAIYHTVGKHFGMKRTKGVYNPRMFAYAWKDFEQMRPTIMGEAKYEGQEPKPDEVVFRGILAPLEKARKLNSAALDLEDAWFSRPQYANALAQYMAANGITVEMMETGAGEITRGPHKGEHITAKIMDEARAYAVKEAQKATYRDLNDLSQFFMRVGKPKTDDPTKVEKVVHVLIEGVIPFRKTPANILVRAMEYSPVGFAHGMKKLLYDVPATYHVRNRLEKLQQKIDAGEELTDKEKKFREKASKFEPTTVAEALDRLCSGMSGTAIFALGMTLAKLGILVAKTDNGDDDQKYFSKLLGHQQWAIETPEGAQIKLPFWTIDVGGLSFTIDWLAPEVVPLFMGAQYFTGFNEGDPIRNFSSLADSLSMVIDPVLELSCMSGIQEALNNAAAFSEGDVNTMVGLASSLGLSYLSQGIPTLFGQLERASQAERMTTFTQDEQLIPADWQYQIGKLSAKIPGWDYHQIPYVDSWGNTETETVLWKRIVANMFNPAYVKKIDTRDVNKELQRLYDATGDGDVLPKPGWKTYRYTDENGKNQTVYLTEEEYLAYGRAKGRNQFDLVSKFLKSNAYKNMTDPDRANVLDDIYYYSEYKAQKEYINNYKGEPYSWVSNYEAFSNTVGGYDVADFIIVRGATRDVKGLYDPKKPGSNAISGTSACNKLLAIYNSGVHIPSDPAQREAFMEALEVAKTYRGYNKAQAEDHLNKTRKKYGITD